jgi:uncharacterized protein
MVALDRVLVPTRAGAREGRLVLLLSALTVAWGLVMRQFGEREIYTIVGSYALGVIGVLLVLYRNEARSWLLPRARDVGVGFLVGGVMTALTYPIYRLSVSLVPALEPVVVGLYRTSHKGSMAAALLWVLVIIAAEELLFRGAWLLALERHLSKSVAFGSSIVLYAAAQAFSGSLIVGLLALCCGALWTLERMLTGSLIAPLLSHMIWTPVVLLLYPVVP